MPFMVRCKYCNYYYFSVTYRDAEAFIIDHICDKHPNVDVEYRIFRISRELYGDYLRCRDNPRFWFALRHVRKPHKIPFLFEWRGGDKPFSGAMPIGLASRL